MAGHSELDTSRRDLDEGAWVALLGHFIEGDRALMETLRQTLPLGSQTIRLAGRDVVSPRLVSWHGDPDAYYRYSGRTFEPHPWTPELAAVKESVDATVGASFNSVLVNFYRDGQDSMGEHADDEPELGPEPDNVLIASVSLGDRRLFLLRHKRTRALHEFDLGDGSLLVMGGTTQRHFKHRVPRTTRPVGPRMNLTFRVVTPRVRG
jgi:alkylated DNA repair dioxygenase AlkB